MPKRAMENVEAPREVKKLKNSGPVVLEEGCPVGNLNNPATQNEQERKVEKARKEQQRKDKEDLLRLAYVTEHGDKPEPAKPEGTLDRQIAFALLSSPDRPLELSKLMEYGAKCFPYWDWAKKGKHESEWQIWEGKKLYNNVRRALTSNKFTSGSRWIINVSADLTDVPEDKKNNLFLHDPILKKWAMNPSIDKDAVLGLYPRPSDNLVSDQPLSKERSESALGSQFSEDSGTAHNSPASEKLKIAGFEEGSITCPYGLPELCSKKIVPHFVPEPHVELPLWTPINGHRPKNNSKPEAEPTTIRGQSNISETNTISGFHLPADSLLNRRVDTMDSCDNEVEYLEVEEPVDAERRRQLLATAIASGAYWLSNCLGIPYVSN